MSLKKGSMVAMTAPRAAAEISSSINTTIED